MNKGNKLCTSYLSEESAAKEWLLNVRVTLSFQRAINIFLRELYFTCPEIMYLKVIHQSL